MFKIERIQGLEPSPFEDLDYACDIEDFESAADLAIEHEAVLNPLPLNPLPLYGLNERQMLGLDRVLRCRGWELVTRDGALWIENARSAQGRAA